MASFLAFAVFLLVLSDNGVISQPFTPGMTPDLVFLLFTALTVVGVITIFAWVDSTIQVALELDFLHRDALRWMKARRFVWAIVILTTVIGVLPIGDPMARYLSFVTILATAISYSGAVLVRAGPRVHDATMRGYVGWMGFIVLAVIFEILITTFNSYLNFPLAIGAYFVYRAATSLSKTSRMAPEVELTSSGPP